LARLETFVFSLASCAAFPQNARPRKEVPNKSALYRSEEPSNGHELSSISAPWVTLNAVPNTSVLFSSLAHFDVVRCPIPKSGYTIVQLISALPVWCYRIIASSNRGALSRSPL